MSLKRYPTRFLLAAILASLLLLGLSGAVAFYLYWGQAQTADTLTEDIGSRGEAADLEESLANLAALHERGVRKVEPLHDRIAEHLAAINRFVNKEQEHEYTQALADSYRAYLRSWAAGGQLTPARQKLLAHHLLGETIPACKQLRVYNAAQIAESEQAHRLALRRMGWGLLVVGGLGSVAGLVLGYGLARSLRQTIHQFLVRVQGAADRLGQELPAIEWQREGPPLDDGADGLLSRVEQAVLRLQQQEREVRRAERLAAVGQLAAGIAHEIRNPLTSAILLIQTGRRDPSAGGLTDEDLDLIEGELQRIEATLQTFLDYARPPRPHRQACDLAAVARDAIALVRGRASRQRVEVRLNAPEEGCVLEADREQLRQVILNLLLNALDAMPCGGSLDLRMSPIQGAVELAVTDTGPGISPEVLPRLFQPFVTGKETGLGLGLVVSQRIIEDHGGAIRGFNAKEPGIGASFVVRLPTVLSAHPSSPARATGEKWASCC